ncbi:MAG TPA: SIMPL domain-containing protein [Solirubrobacter sp.]|nr:SIMPL domain-containing protein [Solirubrobacter sp.]
MRVLLTLAIFALLAAPAAAQTVDTTPTVAADGVGFASLTPDLADFAVSIRSTARTSAKARSTVNRRVAAVVRVARAAGVAADDIRTIRLTVSRERVKPKKRAAYHRYQARQYLQVRMRDVTKLGALLDAVAGAGAEELEAPEFGFADPSQGRLLATRAALADARRRADDAAATQGLRITGVRSIMLAPDSSGDGDEAQTLSGGSDDSASSGGGRRAGTLPTTVAPGTQQFAERVRVVYTAAPAA